MQTVKPRALFVEGEWIVHGAGVVRVRQCLNEALEAWRRRVLYRQLGLPHFS